MIIEWGRWWQYRGHEHGNPKSLIFNQNISKTVLILFYFIPLREPHYPATGWNQTRVMTCLGPAVSCWPSVTFTSCWRKDLEAVSSWESSLSDHNHQLTRCSFDHHHKGRHQKKNPPIPKGCYHKKWGYWDIFAKKGVLTQSIGILSKKNWEYFGIFRQKGGGLANSEISLSEKTGASELLRGGGVSEFRSFSEKKNIFFLCLPLLTGVRCRATSVAKKIPVSVFAFFLSSIFASAPAAATSAPSSFANISSHGQFYLSNIKQVCFWWMCYDLFT